ncbi:rhodanese-like domain-containing protein [Nodularia spumigena]|uniref:rhodanese-like domain-containing protein n=1 Tax=Nodularia spumigena TaxID=70799 RepID=UPI002B21606B|nr:rhodanese-like domain-containing protein [Nodularia spumigena]MEA5614553.1 rhodanese-like domain-containing protein [Nodularia spumigena UHCC 0040]
MQTIQAQELKRILSGENDTPVINVLGPEDYRDKHIPATVNIPVSSDDFTRKVEQHVHSKSKPVVVYCAKTECDASEKAAKKLEAAGFTTVMDFSAGVAGWESAGYELEGRQEPRA